LSYSQAAARGAYVADNTTAASYKVVATKSPAEPSNLTTDNLAVGKFKKSKRSDFMIEPSKNRIDTFGEKQQLTVARLLAGERKKKFSSLL
jgi:hypothetical protein